MTTGEVLKDILAWSLERPSWQRDALRRLFTGEPITPEVVGELVELCKAPYGLAPPRAAKPLSERDIAIQSHPAAPVSLLSVTHHRGVNALAAEQTVDFGGGLTVVYGQNAAGKSGYTRILKRACRSRGREDILGNVLSGETPLSASATIRFREGATEDSVPWTHDGEASRPLASISVFDAQSAAVYLKDKTDVAFRPFGLDVFDKLSALCVEVKLRLEQEQRQLTQPLPGIPVLAEGTRARVFLDGLTGLTKAEDVRALGTLTAGEAQTLSDLRQRSHDLKMANPKQRAHELSLKAERLLGLARHVDNLSTALGGSAIGSIRAAADASLSANDALKIVRRAAFPEGALRGTGSKQWGAMWDATRLFSVVAYPGMAFPYTGTEARCLLCQQALEQEAATRLEQFATFVTSRAHGESRSADFAYRSLVEKAEAVAIESASTVLEVAELRSEDETCAEVVARIFAEAHSIQDQVKAAANSGADLPLVGVTNTLNGRIEAIASSLQTRSADLQSERASLSDSDERLIADLEARLRLGEAMQAVLDDIERRKHLLAHRQCLDDTSTLMITRKSTELTKALVTDRLRETFAKELSKLHFTHLSVEVCSAGGARGLLYHRLAFANAPGVAVIDVLSEGESKALSLAAFMTELSTAPSQAAIIFDDPVSSLDHLWRERIAGRLVSEASQRQVIVFTHDILFLRLLLDEAARRDVECHHQYLYRSGQPGLSSTSLPWPAMRVTDRIGHLRTLWQAAEKTFRTESTDEYERDARALFGLMREAWEQAVSEVLLNDVVERFRPSIQTQKVKKLHDITVDDCKVVDEAMTECSRWIRGHDSAAADGSPIPGPLDVKKGIDELEAWVRAVRRRRN